MPFLPKRPTTTPSTLSALMKAQWKAVDELTQLNRLRKSLKDSVIDQVGTNLKGTLNDKQLKQLINHKSTRAELDRIVNHHTLNPHQDPNHLTDAIAKELETSCDYRVQFLLRLASKDIRGDFQKILNESIETNAKAKKAFELTKTKQVNGEDTNQIRESLKAATSNDASGRPRMGAKLRSILSDVDDETINALEKTLEAEALTTAIDDDNVSEVVDRALKHHSITLSPSTQQAMAKEVGGALMVEAAAIDESAFLSDFRTQMISDDVDADHLDDTLNQAGQTRDDVYHAASSGATPSRITSSARIVDVAVENPTYDHVAQIIDSPRYSPYDLIQEIHQYIRLGRPPSTTGGAPSNFFSSAQTWGQEFGGSVSRGSRAIFEPLGSAFKKMGSGSLGSTFKNIGSALGKIGKTIGPGLKQVGGAMLKGLGSLGSLLINAGIAFVINIGPYVAAIFIIIFFVFIMYQLLSPGSSYFSIANRKMAVDVSTPVDAGFAESNPYIGAIKTAAPNQFENPNGTVTYTYTITAKQEPLTNVTITDKTTISLEAGTRDIDLTIPTPPTTIDKEWTSPSFTLALKPDMDDSIITNTVTIDAQAGGGPQQFTTSASVIIGNPPTGCFVLTNPPGPSEITAVSWDANSAAKAQELAAAAKIIAGIGVARTALCAGPIKVYLASSGLSVDFGGYSLGGGIIAVDYKFGSLGGDNNALYTLAHETGHVYNDRTGISGTAFRQSGLVSWDGNSCVGNIYPFTHYLTDDYTCYSENFAEGLARYINPACAKGPLPENWQSWYASMFE